MCNCIDITIGSYDAQIKMYPPDWSSKEFIGIDICISLEIAKLWWAGIITTGCCCGHNQLPGFIGVEFRCIAQMKALGYEVAYNSCRPNDEDSFKPKSI